MGSPGSSASAALISDATRSANRCGLRAGIDPAMRSVVQRKRAPWETSIRAMNATSPSPIRQYRLRYQRGPALSDVEGPALSDVEGSDIGGLIARAPHCQDDGRIGRVGFNLLPKPFDERVHAAHCDECLVFPHFVQQGFAAEDDPRVRQEYIQELKLVRGQLHLSSADEHAPAGRVDFDVLV